MGGSIIYYFYVFVIIDDFLYILNTQLKMYEEEKISSAKKRETSMPEW